MALALESTIMQEVGLGQHYNYFNGSGSCEYIRREAMGKLQAAIQKHHDNGEEIAAPTPQLMALAREAPTWDENQYVLTKTWEVASYIIAAHIHGYHNSQSLTNTADYISKNYRSAFQQRQWSGPLFDEKRRK